MCVRSPLVMDAGQVKVPVCAVSLLAAFAGQNGGALNDCISTAGEASAWTMKVDGE